MMNLYAKVYNLLNSKEEGATMVEYGLMVALIAVLCITAVTALSTGIQDTFTSAAASL
jgi:pilus assembly protein Flp/PilA